MGGGGGIISPVYLFGQSGKISCRFYNHIEAERHIDVNPDAIIKSNIQTANVYANFDTLNVLRMEILFGIPSALKGGNESINWLNR